MAIDQARISKFLNHGPIRRQIASVFQHAGFTVTCVFEEDKGARWGFYLRLPTLLKKQFGTAREILVWVAQYAEFQAKTLTQAGYHRRTQAPVV
jgi:hypothetical protein